MIKYKFFDYDQTLVSHDYPNWYYNRDYKEEVKNMLSEYKRSEIFNYDRPLQCMRWYAMEGLKLGTANISLTHEIFNLRSELKQNRLKEWYGDCNFSYYEVDSPEHKVDFILAFAEMHDVLPSEC